MVSEESNGAAATSPPVVESFSSFVVRELGCKSSPAVQELLSKLAVCYINGSDGTSELIEELTEVLSSEGKIAKPRSQSTEEDVGDSEPARRSSATDKRTAIMSAVGENPFADVEGAKETDKELFRTDFAVCLPEVIYEYLSTNWNHMDALIQANTSADKKEEAEEAEKAKVATIGASLWQNKFKKGFFRKKILADLAAQREMTTMIATLKSVHLTAPSPEVQLAREVLFKSYPPTIVFLGGGMGAGKSTVVSLLKKLEQGAFADEPLVVEADDLKMNDPIFQALNVQENGSNEVSQLVHSFSTEAANKQLLAALKNQRTIVMDGTMTWMPYVQQTLKMVRNAHKFQYSLGPGYVQNDDGTTTEEYWSISQALTDNMDDGRRRLPYKVEMVGVTVDPEKAVARGLRRKLITSRGVPVFGQLRSHRLYSQNFEPYLPLFDKVSLYDTSGTGDPQMVALKEKGQPLLCNPESYEKFLTKKTIHDGAGGVEDMYGDGTKVPFDRPFWTDVLKNAFD